MKKILGLILTALIITTAIMTGCKEPNVKEKKIPLESLELKGTNETLVLGEELKLVVIKEPSNATDKLVWISDNPEFVSVTQNGRIKALQVTDPDIEITIAVLNENSSIYDLCYVKVINQSDLVPVNGLTLNPETLSLKMGQTVTGQLVAEVQPKNATKQGVNWISSDNSVATVSANGQVTALKAGTAVITATSSEGGFTKTCAVTVAPAEQIVVEGGITITDSSGWLETLFVKWTKMGAAAYNVYYKGNGIANWTKIDNPLIREYDDHYRADILGLKAGIYEVEVRAANASGVEFGDYGGVSNITVEAHIRSGFAFVNNKVPGAYNKDGTPKADARIIYITEQNKETVTLTMRDNTNNRESQYSGLQEILKAYEKGYESRPTIIRFIGRINEKKGLPFTDSEGSVMVKGNSTAARPINVDGMNLTLEGVGDDATAYGWGIRTSRANSVEIRNLGFMLGNTDQKDAIELTTQSKYMWVHNNDIFYGKPGSAADQKKGDGSLDIKEGDFITISFNHFWDSGKSNLLGNGTEDPGNLTYHHNWYDHSDSRHPRVRFHFVHVYNNFFDGVGKYGMGATKGSSIFSDRNYFLNTRKPMLISMQGTDIASGGGTFSSEAGGIIKAYGNVMQGVPAGDIRPWSQSNQVEFDYYVVANPNDPVPETVTTKKKETAGSARSTYNNDFLTYSYDADTAEAARTRVTKYAGRYWGGDFKFTFPSGSETHVDEPMAALLSALNTYTSKLVSIQGGSNPGPGNPDPDPGNQGGGGTPNPDPGQPGIGDGVDGGIILIDGTFTATSGLTNGTDTIYKGLIFGTNWTATSAQAVTVDGINFTHRAGSGGSANLNRGYLGIPLKSSATVTLYVCSQNSSARNFGINTTNSISATRTPVTTGYAAIPGGTNASPPGPIVYKSTVQTPHIVWVWGSDNIRHFGIKVEYD